MEFILYENLMTLPLEYNGKVWREFNDEVEM